ncbi:MAG TPA: DUF692 family protein [Candidatus Limnocylindria bacterium]|nr:DUF692 family protein [Candidatus Limnocylindria bacterium]
MTTHATETRDRVGLSWRGPLAAAILSNLDRIDVIELMLEDFIDASGPVLGGARLLRSSTPVMLHGVSLGLASVGTVSTRRLDRVARVVNAIEPESWTEHLAFVRAGDIEIGHLAAPPRTIATVEGTARNVDRAAKVLGARPLLENIATLVDPPGSALAEDEWVSATLNAADVDLLLDLHNLHANAINFGFDAVAYLGRIPIHRVRQIHIAGGRWVTLTVDGLAERRLLDDHLHDVPDPVYRLLVEVAARASGPLTVILERDGRFPSTATLLKQLDQARAALREGRARAHVPAVAV